MNFNIHKFKGAAIKTQIKNYIDTKQSQSYNFVEIAKKNQISQIKKKSTRDTPPEVGW